MALVMSEIILAMAAICCHWCLLVIVYFTYHKGQDIVGGFFVLSYLLS